MEGLAYFRNLRRLIALLAVENSEYGQEEVENILNQVSSCSWS